MQLKAAQRDAKAAVDAAQFAEQKAQALDAENVELNKKVTALENTPHTSCPLGDRANGLHGIAPRQP
jgi:hypothetical protein